MSILNSWWRAFHALLFPPHCIVCDEPLDEGEIHFCIRCRATAPLTGYAKQPHNPLFEHLAALVPIERASALLFFHHASPWRRLIHRFKYHHRAAFAREMGRWLGEVLKRSNQYDDLTVIVPLPLHPLRRLVRGYNQSEWIADGIAEVLGLPVDRQSVVRCRYTPAQALKPHRERAENMARAFSVGRPERLTGHHVLLVDDVLTTGSTLVACTEALLDEVPDCKVSIAVLAVTGYLLRRA